MQSRRSRSAAEAEFTELVRDQGRRLHRAAVLLCGDPHLAEDLTQTTLTKVYSHWTRVSGVDDRYAYCHRMLVNTFLSHRRLRRNTELPMEQSDHEASGHGTDRAERIDLLRALRTLKGSDRAVVVLRYWEDLSVTEVAALLDISEPAVRTRAKRALARLRPLIAEQPIATLDTIGREL